jgi:UDP-N-acetylglucosamine 2-epimerase (hydrolysing)
MSLTDSNDTIKYLFDLPIGLQQVFMSKKLLFITGTRADFGKIEPLAIAAQAANFHIGFFITGMHMMARYGNTNVEVKRFKHADFFEFVNQKAGDSQELILAKTILGLSDFLHEHKPDLVIIHGDRIEALAAALVCSMKYIRSAHIEGGEISGTIDESIRHCNTKLCTSHFVSSHKARDRVLSLGEPSQSIYTIGSPELDVHLRPSGVDLATVKAYYQIPFEANQYGIVIFHPVTSEVDTIGEQAAALFKALEDSQQCFVVIAPNNDPGTEAIFSVLNRLPKTQFRLIPSMRFAYFSELMRHAQAIIGNSSAGVREAPFLGIPSLDIGSRQNNRSNAPSLVNCSALDTETIQHFFKQFWGKRFEQHTGFGAGNAAQLFVDILNTESFWQEGLQKGFHD